MKGSARLFLMSALLICAVLYFINSYHKWDASWGPFPVVGLGLVGAALTWWLLGKMYWFDRPYGEASLAMCLWPSIGAVICIMLGINFTEPKEQDAWQPDERGQLVYRYDYGRTPVGHRYYSWQEANFGPEMASEASDAGSSDVDLGDDGEGLALLLVIVLVIVLVVASAVVPHFWVFASLVLATVTLRVAWREHQVETREPNRFGTPASWR